MPDDLSAFLPQMPNAVRRQAARSEELIQEQVAAAAADAPLVTTVVTDPPAPVAAPPVATPPPAPTDDWEQRYRTLQGKYDTEVPDLRGQLAGIQRVLSTMQATPPASAPAPVAAPPARIEIPAADVEAYGQDLIDAARRWMQPELTSLRDQVTKLELRLATVSGEQQTAKVMTAQERVQAYMDRDPAMGPTWRTTNNTPEFLAWLNQRDPFSGTRRQDLLTAAYTGGDAERTAEFFRAYSREHTAAPAPAVTLPHTPPATPPGAGGPTLADLAAPGRGNAPPVPPGAQSEKRMWRSSEIAAFYRDVQRGVYAGKEPERLAIEQDIIAAPMEGRIIIK